MPYINVKTSAKLDDNTKNNILKKLSKAATLIPGKSEAYVMCEIDDGKAMISLDGAVWEEGAAPMRIGIHQVIRRELRQRQQEQIPESCDKE